jgi:hypothetical protein
MQNMICQQDEMGIVQVYFDVKDGDIVNISAKDNGNPITLDQEQMEEVRSYLAREYAASAIEMALVYKSGMVPLMC